MKPSYFVKLAFVTLVFSTLILVFAFLIQPNIAERKKTATVRQIIYERIGGLLQYKQVLLMSADFFDEIGNTRLKHCLEDITECSPNLKAVPFVLLKNINPPYQLLSGTSENPALYSSDGELGCEEKCKGWEVKTYFSVRCPVDNSKCKTPKYLDVYFQIIPTQSNISGLEAGALPEKLLLDDFTKATASFEI